MYSVAGRLGLRAVRPSMAVRNAVAKRFEHSASQSERDSSRGALTQGAKRDPELYVCLSDAVGALLS